MPKPKIVKELFELKEFLADVPRKAGQAGKTMTDKARAMKAKLLRKMRGK